MPDKDSKSAATDTDVQGGASPSGAPASSGSAPAASSVAVVYARLPLPQMSCSNIESWFTTMDFWFTASGISSDKQKTATVLAALDPSVIAQLMDVISSMPLIDRYDFVRSKIIEHFADSEQRRLNRLLSEMPLGDRKPSELYYEMKRVAGTTLGEAALKGLWIKRLPDIAQAVVAASTGNAADFTKIADSIWDALSTNNIRAISKSGPSEIDDLRQAIADLTRKFENFTSRSRSRSRNAKSRVRHKSSSKGKDQGDNSSGSVECWYHHKYGRDARKCRSPCRHNQRSVNTVSDTSEVSA